MIDWLIFKNEITNQVDLPEKANIISRPCGSTSSDTCSGSTETQASTFNPVIGIGAGVYIVPFFPNLIFRSNVPFSLPHLIFFTTSLIIKGRGYCFPYPLFPSYILPYRLDMTFPSNLISSPTDLINFLFYMPLMPYFCIAYFVCDFFQFCHGFHKRRKKVNWKNIQYNNISWHYVNFVLWNLSSMKRNINKVLLFRYSMEGQMGARVVATKHWSKGDQISSLIGSLLLVAIFYWSIHF